MNKDDKVLLLIDDINAEIVDLKSSINDAKYYIKETEEMIDNINRYLIDIESTINE